MTGQPPGRQHLSSSMLSRIRVIVLGVVTLTLLSPVWAVNVTTVTDDILASAQELTIVGTGFSAQTGAISVTLKTARTPFPKAVGARSVVHTLLQEWSHSCGSTHYVLHTMHVKQPVKYRHASFYSFLTVACSFYVFSYQP